VKVSLAGAVTARLAVQVALAGSSGTRRAPLVIEIDVEPVALAAPRATTVGAWASSVVVDEPVLAPSAMRVAAVRFSELVDCEAAVSSETTVLAVSATLVEDTPSDELSVT
jgi:hypothetical protein